MRWNRRDVLSLIFVGWATSLPLTAQADGDGVPSPRAKGEPAAKASPARPVVAPDPRRMEELLSLWEKRSTLLKSLDVKFKRDDVNPAWGTERFEGRAMLQSPNLAWIDTKKVAVDARKQETLVPHERIVCTGKEVWQYHSPTHQIFIFPLERQQQQRALEEGPLPFLFNMKAAEAKKRYQMSLVDENADAYVVAVLPRLEIDKESFSKAFIQLDKEYLLPTRIVLYATDGKSTQDYKFSNTAPNAKVDARNFDLKPLPPPWKVVRNPGGDGPRRPAADNPAAPAPRQPAFREERPKGRRR